MSRSGYGEDGDYDDVLEFGRWRAQVASAIRGKRGQKFLQELAAAMDAMPEKRLIEGELIDADGACCTMGVICKQRAIDLSKHDYLNTKKTGELLGIAHQLAAEIAFENDERGFGETPEQRWTRMRQWVAGALQHES